MRGDTPPVSGWGATTVGLRGVAESRLLSPEGFSLWMFKGRLADGAALRWDGAHGDEVVYVATGELAVDGRVCPAGGAVIIEADVAAEAVAHGDCELLHYGPRDPRPPVDGPNGPPAPGCTVHVVGPGGTWAQVDGTRETWYFADSTCPTCRATLLRTGRTAARESPAHSHTQDELIHVLYGTLQLGAGRAGPGDTLAIAGNVRYRFRTDEAFAFLNYRRDASHQIIDRAAPPILEGGEVHGFTPVMDLR